MAQGKSEPTVATPAGWYSRMRPRWRMTDVLLGGTEALRAAGKEFLPQYDNETATNYENRKARATLLNMTERVLDTLAGKPFREPLVLGDDVPEALVAMAEDIDLQGNNLHSFCQTWFRDAWAKGFSHVLVEYPTPANPEAGGVRTLADDRSEGLRPFWVHIKPECLIAACSAVVRGKEVLTHVRIMEQTVERVAWGEVTKTRIRVLEPGYWALWAPNDTGSEWRLESQGQTSLDYIPLVTFYAGKRSGFMECKPPLTDLAFLNIAHWQSSSDQRNVLTVSRFPILAASGVAADQVVNIGPNNFLTTEDTQGKWYYVEHSGAAIAAGAVDLSSLEDQMALYGAEFLRKKPGGETATAAALGSAESSSVLAASAQAFQDCVEQALMFTAGWVGEENGGSVRVNTDVDSIGADAAELDTLLKMRAARDISRISLLQEMTARGLLADHFDSDADAEQLQAEGQNTLPSMFDGQGDGGAGLEF